MKNLIGFTVLIIVVFGFSVYNGSNDKNLDVACSADCLFGSCSEEGTGRCVCFLGIPDCDELGMNGRDINITLDKNNAKNIDKFILFIEEEDGIEDKDKIVSTFEALKGAVEANNTKSYLKYRDEGLELLKSLNKEKQAKIENWIASQERAPNKTSKKTSGTKILEQSCSVSCFFGSCSAEGAGATCECFLGSADCDARYIDITFDKNNAKNIDKFIFFIEAEDGIKDKDKIVSTFEALKGAVEANNTKSYMKYRDEGLELLKSLSKEKQAKIENWIELQERAPNKTSKKTNVRSLSKKSTPNKTFKKTSGTKVLNKSCSASCWFGSCSAVGVSVDCSCEMGFSFCSGIETYDKNNAENIDKFIFFIEAEDEIKDKDKIVSTFEALKGAVEANNTKSYLEYRDEGLELLKSLSKEKQAKIENWIELQESAPKAPIAPKKMSKKTIGKKKQN